ncbi:hypothetical protein Dde_2401 [Oleidesulfovibrio alaskensis G20]|uniref:Uncharacterized protein n=1 Tax=Oleidesulfovibrio alaskensis (strain ATCC BAA-1058 / DSM 17464 / G20) TaxID=207559 RepID=Q30YP8_OLEA2|nr:hypothetical protein [Oleidesulfovibrio alaskensis]ABB39198.1 hypothetical protein Dde_2401 [Oleidesulfovibrio alaskensis G20]
MAAKTANDRKLKKRIAQIKSRKAQQMAQKGDFSDLLYTFCRPLLAVQDELNGPENAIGMGVFAWNAAFLEKDRWQRNLANSLGQYGLSSEVQDSLTGIVEEMIRQKHLMYPGDRRVIVDYDVRVEKGTVHVTADYREASKTIMPKFQDISEAPSATCTGRNGQTQDSGQDVAQTGQDGC